MMSWRGMDEIVSELLLVIYIFKFCLNFVNNSLVWRPEVLSLLSAQFCLKFNQFICMSLKCI